jgi:hypothetical protein
VAEGLHPDIVWIHRKILVLHINLAAGAKAPEVYTKGLIKQCRGGKTKYSGITDAAGQRSSLHISSLSGAMLDGQIHTSNKFLEQRRNLAKRVKT